MFQQKKMRNFNLTFMKTEIQFFPSQDCKAFIDKQDKFLSLGLQ